MWYNKGRMTGTMILYHGSERVIEKPVFGQGKPYNDYGLGFYCTEDVELAKEWACAVEDRGGYANQYAFNSAGLTVLDLNAPSFCILHWISILLKNRRFALESVAARRARDYILENFPVDTSGADVITGYRANDSYFSYARDFLQNTISVKRLSQVMKLGRLGKQIVLVSPRAFDRLVFTGAESVDGSVYYPLRKNRDSAARDAYLTDKAGAAFGKGEIYLIDVLREAMKADDARLRPELP